MLRGFGTQLLYLLYSLFFDIGRLISIPSQLVNKPELNKLILYELIMLPLLRTHCSTQGGTLCPLAIQCSLKALDTCLKGLNGLVDDLPEVCQRNRNGLLRGRYRKSIYAMQGFYHMYNTS